MGTVRVGIAGWVYEPWRGSFYPEGLKARDELAFAASVLGTIEINATFYRTQTPTSFAAWRAAAPEGFTFSVKGSRFITQGLKARDPEPGLANFFASGPFLLGDRLGPFVWQFPSHLQFEAAIVERFVAALPKDPDAASRLAARHDERITAPVIATNGAQSIRHAVEVNHPSFRAPEFLNLLKAHNVALVLEDTADWPDLDLTAEFVYARLKGPPGGGGYAPSDLDLWAERLSDWAAGRERRETRLVAAPAPARPRDAFVYFVHEDKLHAPHNAQALIGRLKGTGPTPAG